MTKSVNSALGRLHAALYSQNVYATFLVMTGTDSVKQSLTFQSPEWGRYRIVVLSDLSKVLYSSKLISFVLELES